MIPILILSENTKLINSYVDKLKADSLFFKIEPSTKEYSIDDIKNIKKETSISFPKTRVYFFYDFHLSSIPAQNSFLKLLEEPPSNVQFILSTNYKSRLLPTIISRVKIVKLQNNVGAKFITPETKQFIASLEDLLNKTPTAKIPLSLFKITDKESAIDIFLQIIIFLKERWISNQSYPSMIKEILRLKGLLESNNLNPQLSVDQALIFIWKTYRIKENVKL